MKMSSHRIDADLIAKGTESAYNPLRFTWFKNVIILYGKLLACIEYYLTCRIIIFGKKTYKFKVIRSCRSIRKQRYVLTYGSKRFCLNFGNR